MFGQALYLIMKSDSRADSSGAKSPGCGFWSWGYWARADCRGNLLWDEGIVLQDKVDFLLMTSICHIAQLPPYTYTCQEGKHEYVNKWSAREPPLGILWQVSSSRHALNMSFLTHPNIADECARKSDSDLWTKQEELANKLQLPTNYTCSVRPCRILFLWIEPKLKGNMRLNGTYKPTNIEPISLLEAPLRLGFTKSRNHSAMAVFKLKFHGWRLGPYPQDSQVVNINDPPFSSIFEPSAVTNQGFQAVLAVFDHHGTYPGNIHKHLFGSGLNGCEQQLKANGRPLWYQKTQIHLFIYSGFTWTTLFAALKCLCKVLDGLTLFQTLWQTQS